MRVKAKSEPVRMCVGCRDRKRKEELLRFVERDGVLFFDPFYRAEGRGMNLCPSRRCFERALKKSVLDRALRTSLAYVPSPEELRDQVLDVLKDAIVNSLRMGYRFRGVVLGREAVFRNADRLSLLILAEDLSENSLREIEPLEVESYTLFTKEYWGETFNRKPTGVIGVLDRGIANKVSNLAEKFTALYRRWS